MKNYFLEVLPWAIYQEIADVEHLLLTLAADVAVTAVTIVAAVQTIGAGLLFFFSFLEDAIMVVEPVSLMEMAVDVAADVETMTIAATGFGLLFYVAFLLITAAASNPFLPQKRVRMKRTLLVCFMHMLHKIRQTYERKHM